MKGLLFGLQGDLLDALEEFEYALKLFPEFYLAKLCRAITLLKVCEVTSCYQICENCKHKEAIQDLRKCEIKINSHSSLIHCAYRRYYKIIQRHEQTSDGAEGRNLQSITYSRRKDTSVEWLRIICSLNLANHKLTEETKHIQKKILEFPLSNRGMFLDFINFYISFNYKYSEQVLKRLATKAAEVRTSAGAH
jgi:hypothetical protein